MKIALVGTAPSGKDAPVNDPSWKIWGVGKRAEYMTRADRWFELHRLDGEKQDWAAEWRELMMSWSNETEIWMFYPENLGPRIVQMDPKPLIAKYGEFFMTSSFSWMMAQAIEEGAKEIGLWGVDMEYGTEYRQQRVGLRHFIEVAKLAGIKVHRVASSGIAFEPMPYPFWMDDPILSKVALRNAALKQNKFEAAYAADNIQVVITQLQGAKSELLRLMKEKPRMKAYINKRIEHLDNLVESHRKGYLNALEDVNKLQGSLDELAWLEDYLRP